MGAPSEEQSGIPFTEGVMADELPMNCHTPTITEYDGTTDPHEHLSHFENAALLHQYIDATKFDALLARAAKYINMEDAQTSKREGRGEKRKENKDEGPSKNPKTVLRTRNQHGRGQRIPRSSTTGKAEVSDPPRKCVIRMTVGGSARGDSQRARKAQIRVAYGTLIREVMDVEPADDAHLIHFDQEDRHSGSSVDILFGEAYDQMQLRDVPLETMDTSLYGFAGEARKCYVEAIKKGKNRGLEETPGEENSNKRGKDPILSPEPKEDAPVAVQPVEELLTVELIPGYPWKVTKIGSKTEKGLPFFITLRKVKNFEWTKEFQQAFEEFKAYLARLPLLVKPSPGDTLYLYISSTSQTVSSVLVREEENTQTSIYYVSKVLNGVEKHYPPIKKMALTLVITARKLRPYFLSHPVGVRTNTSLKQVLGKPEASGRLVKWTIELSEYDISYLPRTTIKAQTLADFVSKMTGTTQEGVFEEKPWILHVDGSSTTQGSGAGIIITSPQGEDMEFAIKFDFNALNNKAEYEALVLGMRIA
ncbi:UNVERIFIED_CONTAM: hypothetical protein Slati_0014100 [Sesamum latifolium]|uniref:Reverse transcriptase/retrotransposon-derived protein RNase H-like domain-containing protein n=1 Tax=Sesamum latifolium TaxID=2727402 RepID=A0AAW2Y6F2_9LAMI